MEWKDTCEQLLNIVAHLRATLGGSNSRLRSRSLQWYLLRWALILVQNTAVSRIRRTGLCEGEKLRKRTKKRFGKWNEWRLRKRKSGDSPQQEKRKKEKRRGISFTLSSPADVWTSVPGLVSWPPLVLGSSHGATQGEKGGPKGKWRCLATLSSISIWPTLLTAVAKLPSISQHDLHISEKREREKSTAGGRKKEKCTHILTSPKKQKKGFPHRLPMGFSPPQKSKWFDSFTSSRW